MLRMIKFGMLLEKHSLQYMKLSKILFFVKFMQPELLIKFPKLWMLLKKLPKLCWVVVDTVLQLLTRSRLSELWLVNITFGAGHRWIFWQKIYCWVKKFPSIFHFQLSKFSFLSQKLFKICTFWEKIAKNLYLLRKNWQNMPFFMKKFAILWSK